METHGTARREAVDLPSDVKLLVLDHVSQNDALTAPLKRTLTESKISVKANLKALCLTSKAWHSVANQRLYRDISVEVYSNTHVARFMRCVAAGAGLNLRHARSLTLVCKSAPPNAVILPCASSQKEAMSAEKDHSVRLIIEMMPKNSLQGFWLISDSPLSADSFKTLRDRQQHLKRVQSISQFQELYGAFPELDTIDFKIPISDYNGPRSQKRRLDQLSSFRNLRRLSLQSCCSKDFLSAWKDTATKPNYTGIQLKLRELSLHCMDLNAQFPPFSRMCDFSTLARLTLRECGYALQFLSQLAIATRSQRLKFEHLAVLRAKHIDGVNPDTGIDPDTTTVEESLLEIIKSTDTLRSLHISWDDSQGDDLSALQLLSRESTQGLSSFSFWESTGYGEARVFDDVQFEGLCKELPKLQQLAINLDTMFEHDSFMAYANFLKYLPQLRILHARTTIWNSYGRPMSEEHIAFVNQRAATELFRFLHSEQICPKLQIFVTGAYALADMEELGFRYDHGAVCRQHCFYSTEQIIAGRRLIVAAPISYTELLELEPDLDILDWDPNNNWVGRLPGQFHGW